MKFGAQVTCYRNTWESIRQVAGTLDTGPWGSIWFADHYLPPGRKEEEYLTAHEGFTVAAAVAEFTKSLRIGHLVLGNTYRNPALVAKMATTLDQVSQGRFTLGIGAAWFKREHEAYGWTFPSMKERQDRFQEVLRIIRALFHSQESVTVRGEYYSVVDAPMSPGSYNEGGIPILVGGTGEKRTLRALAMYGDIMNMDGWAGGPMTVDFFQHKVSVVNQHCERLGRDPSDIRHTVLVPTMVSDDSEKVRAFVSGRRLGARSAAGPKSYVIDRIGGIVEAGADEIMIGGIPSDDLEQYQMVAEEILSQF